MRGSSQLRTARTAARAVAVALSAMLLVASCGGNDGKTGVSLILKTQTNPYFIAMKQAARRRRTRPEYTCRWRPDTPTATPRRRSTRSRPRSRAATRAS